MASYGKPAPWTHRGQNQLFNYTQNAPVSYPLSYMQEHHGSKSGNVKSRSFTGVVTKMLDNHGFIDKEVYFHIGTCEKSYPKQGDRVMVEAVYNPNNPHKWTSTRVQVIEERSKPYSKFDGLSKRERSPMKIRENFPRRIEEEPDRKRRRIERGNERPRDHREKVHDRERERDRLLREREKKEHGRQISPRRQRRSPLRSRAPLRYVVKIPTDLLTIFEYDAVSLRRRFSFYIPSDFFISLSPWTEVFQPERPFALDTPCSFHVMHKECDSLNENTAVIDPPDADYLYTAQVMLVSFPTVEEIYKKCIAVTEDEDKNTDRTVHITRLIHFLVRSRKNEPASIGGPWSPSLDGENPDKDPSVLIKTAIRTCKALTGVDLSSCTQWYRFVEIYYHRSESVYKGKVVPARVETAVYFLPEVWSCAPTQLEWHNLVSDYGKVLEVKISPTTTTTTTPTPHEVNQTSEDAKPASVQSQNQTAQKDELENDDKEEELVVIGKCEPTHYSKLDPKNMKVNELRQELEARSISAKGLKSQLLARLLKALKAEEEQEQQKDREISLDKMEEAEESSENVNDASVIEEKSKDATTTEVTEEEKQETVQTISETERATWVKRYTLPATPHILVHPSKTAKGGKFECNLVSLHSLLVYHSDFVKEDVFEVRLFAELFNDMLTRDFGYNIFKALYRAPEKPKEEKDKKEAEEKKDKLEKKDDKIENGEDEEKLLKDDETKMDETTEGESKEETYITIDEDKTVDNKPESEEGELTKDEKDGDIEDKDAEKEDADKANKEKEEAKKKKPVQMYTKDKHLLLSFSFFDQSSCGYIFEKDLESLFQSLGLYYSRSQIKKMINKVSVRDTVHYRKLTDEPVKDDEEGEGEGEKQEKKEDDNNENQKPVEIISNKKLLQDVLGDGNIDSSKKITRKGKADTKLSEGFVNYSGIMIDIEKLLSSIKRSESARLEMEYVIQNLMNENESLKENVNATSEKAKSTSADLQTCRGKLMSSNREIIFLKGKMKNYVKVLTSIKEHVDPLLQEIAEKPAVPEKVAEQAVSTSENNTGTDNKENLQQSDENDSGVTSVDTSEAPMEQQSIENKPEASGTQATTL